MDNNTCKNYSINTNEYCTIFVSLKNGNTSNFLRGFTTRPVPNREIMIINHRYCMILLIQFLTSFLCIHAPRVCHQKALLSKFLISNNSHCWNMIHANNFIENLRLITCQIPKYKNCNLLRLMIYDSISEQVSISIKTYHMPIFLFEQRKT